MPDDSPKNCAVRAGKLTGETPSQALVFAQAICARGAGCAAVQGSPVAAEALGEFNAAVQTAQGSLAAKAAAEKALAAAIKALDGDMQDVRRKLTTYEGAVTTIANGNPSVITDAGLESRPMKAPPAALEPVEKVDFGKGKAAGQAFLRWPAAKGAGSYAVEVNYTPQTQDAGPWTQLVAAANRTRIIDAPAPGAQVLARVASVGRDGKMSAWSCSVLVTAR